MQVGGAVAALGSAQLDWRVHCGLESFPQVGASEPPGIFSVALDNNVI